MDVQHVQVGAAGAGDRGDALAVRRALGTALLLCSRCLLFSKASAPYTQGMGIYTLYLTVLLRYDVIDLSNLLLSATGFGVGWILSNNSLRCSSQQPPALRRPFRHDSS